MENHYLYISKRSDGKIEINSSDGVFSSYAFTERNEYEKNDIKKKFLSPIVKKNTSKIYDALIFDKFNSCYTTALRKLN